jgi:hypothetical protein
MTGGRGGGGIGRGGAGIGRGIAVAVPTGITLWCEGFVLKNICIKCIFYYSSATNE